MKKLHTLIDSAVIAAVTGGFITLFLALNEAKMKHITEERGKWREKIRDIAAKLSTESENADDNDNFYALISGLKVRINAYGLTFTPDSRKYYMNDGHIWAVIRDIEAKNNLHKNLKLLNDYLSFLLKYDWERAKYEVKNNYPFLNPAFWIAFYAISICLNFLMCGLWIIIFTAVPAGLTVFWIRRIAGDFMIKNKYISCLKKYDSSRNNNT